MKDSTPCCIGCPDVGESNNFESPNFLKSKSSNDFRQNLDNDELLLQICSCDLITLCITSGFVSRTKEHYRFYGRYKQKLLNKGVELKLTI